ncbi:hypothetical protein F9C11_34820 [Amycolatopsis sp. VS8301801F10]|uniref:hypothetical protein n=1 Tax=Amycolatopsis sp. VS8301801F10 TaxID=2652442 RepID=UPI0038FC48CC
MDTVADLGPLTSTHRVDNRARRRVGLGMSALGAGAGVLGLLVSQLPIDRAVARILGIVLGLGIALLIVGIHAVAVAVRGGPGERVDVHENGIACRTKRGVRQWSWDRITAIRLRQTESSNPLALKLRTDYWCDVEIDGKRQLVITGMTDEPEELVRALKRRRPDVYDGNPPHPVARLRWWWLGAGIVFFAGLAAAVIFLITHPDTEVQVTHGTITEITDVPAISKDAQPYFYGAMLACLVLGITGIRLFLYATRERR